VTLHPTSDVAFLDSLGDALPEVGAVIHSTRRENDGLALATLEMADVTRWFIAAFRNYQSKTGRAGPAGEVVAKFLWMMEASFETGDQEVDDLIATSFLENLHQAGEDLSGILAILPGKLRTCYREGFGE